MVVHKNKTQTSMKTLHFSKQVALAIALLWCVVGPSSQLTRDQYTSDSAGVLRSDIRDSETLGQDGPTLLQDQLLIERLAIQNRERIPERTVHARGVLAYGTFTNYQDRSSLTAAKFLNGDGKVTPVAVRFSTVIHPRGSPEFLRDPRGFAVKFYTEDGNYDQVGINFPVFFVRDGIRFPDLIRSLKPDPITGLQQWWRIFDYLSNYPESTQMLTYLLDDVGIPKSYRYMHGHSVHAWKWVNATGDEVLVKYYFESQQGEQSLLDSDAILENFSFATFDLYNATMTGNYPSWKVYVQILPVQDSYPDLPFDPLDSTADWPSDMIPYLLIGELTLNSTGHDFLENEQSAFSPGRLVPGILPSNDKLLQARLFSYGDAQRYRLGVNHQLLPVNAPKVTYYIPEVDGLMNFATVKVHEHVNYFPSNYTVLYPGPVPPADMQTQTGTPSRKPITKFDNYSQATTRYLSFDSARQMRFAQRIAERLSEPQTTPKLLAYWLNEWGKVNMTLQANIKKFLNVYKK